MASIVFGHNARKAGTYHDLSWSLQYLESGEQEPALAFCRTATLKRQNNPPVVVIPLSSAWKYAVDSYLVGMAVKYSRFLGFEDASFSAHRIADFMNRMLIELCTLEPLPLDMHPRAPQVHVQADGSFVMSGLEPGLH